MRTFKNIGIAIIASATLVSCFNDKKPNYQYFPNMYEPVSYETYGAYPVFPDEQEAMVPPDNT
ncbi:MAG TPA: cytochrome C, partial [Aequorivita sp.]|nr:cytochrome C [Aequorivita sp.]